ncbi:hypothetical protein CSUI_004524, partial [Cystoisospora suis]
PNRGIPALGPSQTITRSFWGILVLALPLGTQSLLNPEHSFRHRILFVLFLHHTCISSFHSSTFWHLSFPHP